MHLAWALLVACCWLLVFSDVCCNLFLVCLLLWLLLWLVMSLLVLIVVVMAKSFSLLCYLLRIPYDPLLHTAYYPLLITHDALLTAYERMLPTLLLPQLTS